MRQAASDRSLVSHLHVADVRRAFRQQRTNILQQVRRFNLIMCRHRADANLTVFLTNVREVFEATYVDEHRRHRQTEFHRRNQTVSAGENLGVFVLREQS